MEHWFTHPHCVDVQTSANANQHVTLCDYCSNNNAAKRHSDCNIADNREPLQSTLRLVLQKGNTIITWNTSPRKKKKKKTESAGSTPFQITMSEAELYSLMPFWGVFNRIREKGWKVWPGQQKQREKRRAMKRAFYMLATMCLSIDHLTERHSPTRAC